MNPAAVNISAFDLSVLRGDGIFEATTVFKGFPISLENHLRRLSDSARLMDLPTPNIAAITRGIEKVMSAYDDPEPAPYCVLSFRAVSIRKPESAKLLRRLATLCRLFSFEPSVVFVG